MKLENIRCITFLPNDTLLKIKMLKIRYGESVSNSVLYSFFKFKFPNVGNLILMKIENIRQEKKKVIYQDS